MRQIVDTLQERHASLSQEPDFRFMLARDASTAAPILMYLSDRFIAEAAGPRQRILESRRVRAIGELLTPPLSAMLYGYLAGRSPASITDLLKSGLLKASELKHFDGALITFHPGSAPRSVYGTPAAATPLAVPAVEGDSIEGYGAEGLLLKQGGTAIRPRHAEGRGRYQSIFKDLIRARASLAFDPEKGTASDPPARSLHTRVEIEYKK